MPTRAELKQRAKNSLRENKPNIYLVALIFVIVEYVMTSLMAKLTIPEGLYEAYKEAILNGAVTVTVQETPGFGNSLISLALQIMLMILSVGFFIVCLRISRSIAIGFGDLLDGFAHFGKYLWLEILSGLFVYLWSLLFIIPGIIAAYRYRMAIYIQIENPEYSALECINRSKEMMKGHKWECFVLELSFLGWQLLSVIPFVSVYVMPYMHTTMAHYYNELSGYRPEADYTVESDGGWDNKKDPWD